MSNKRKANRTDPDAPSVDLDAVAKRCDASALGLLQRLGPDAPITLAICGKAGSDKHILISKLVYNDTGILPMFPPMPVRFVHGKTVSVTILFPPGTKASKTVTLDSIEDFEDLPIPQGATALEFTAPWKTGPGLMWVELADTRATPILTHRATEYDTPHAKIGGDVVLPWHIDVLVLVPGGEGISGCPVTQQLMFMHPAMLLLHLNCYDDSTSPIVSIEPNFRGLATSGLAPWIRRWSDRFRTFWQLLAFVSTMRSEHFCQPATLEQVCKTVRRKRCDYLLGASVLLNDESKVEVSATTVELTFRDVLCAICTRLPTSVDVDMFFELARPVLLACCDTQFDDMEHVFRVLQSLALTVGSVREKALAQVKAALRSKFDPYDRANKLLPYKELRRSPVGSLLSPGSSGSGVIRHMLDRAMASSEAKDFSMPLFYRSNLDEDTFVFRTTLLPGHPHTTHGEGEPVFFDNPKLAQPDNAYLWPIPPDMDKTKSWTTGSQRFERMTRFYDGKDPHEFAASIGAPFFFVVRGLPQVKTLQSSAALASDDVSAVIGSLSHLGEALLKMFMKQCLLDEREFKTNVLERFGSDEKLRNRVTRIFPLLAEAVYGRTPGFDPHRGAGFESAKEQYQQLIQVADLFPNSLLKLSTFSRLGTIWAASATGYNERRPLYPSIMRECLKESDTPVKDTASIRMVFTNYFNLKTQLHHEWFTHSVSSD